MAVEFQHVLQAHSGVEFSAMDLVRGPMVAGLATVMLNRLMAETGATGAGAEEIVPKTAPRPEASA